MKEMKKTSAVLLLMIPYLNCISMKNYLADRGRDSVDIINLGVERRVYGISFVLFAFAVGLQSSRKSDGFGIRFGQTGSYYAGNESADEKSDEYGHILFHYKEDAPSDIQKVLKPTPTEYGYSNIFSKSTYYYVPKDIFERKRKNKYMLLSSYLLGGTCTAPLSEKRYNSVVGGSLGICGYKISNAPEPFEISIGLYYGIRVGFNPGEIFDFLVGILGFDLMNDDAGWDDGIARKGE